VIYLGSLFALLANAFFGLDDFTGQVKREFTLANFIALAEPANIDVALRTITMAVAVTLACIVLAFPWPTTMARHARGATRPRSTSRDAAAVVELPVRLYAWKLLLAKEGAISWLARRRTPLAARRAAVAAARRRLVAELLHARHLHRVRLHVAAVHDPADPGGHRAHPRVVHRGVERPGRTPADVPPRDPAARAAGIAPARSSRSR
jgi:hypothetical protein